jgi:hypothetical protein
MILLLDHVRTKRSMPDEMRCRMVRGRAAAAPTSAPLMFLHARARAGPARSLPHARPQTTPLQVIPSDGLTSVSLWDTCAPEALKTWLDENLGSDCISQARARSRCALRAARCALRAARCAL